jgi:hypothetical protein
MQIRLWQTTTKVISRINSINGWQNRAIYGVSAIASQPFFDYKNPNVDKTTQKYSLIKTLTKIVVGTGVGIASRAIFQKWGENLYKKGKLKMPNLENLDKNKATRCFGNVFAIIGAIIAMLSVDILISNVLLSYFNKKIEKRSK